MALTASLHIHTNADRAVFSEQLYDETGKTNVDIMNLNGLDIFFHSRKELEQLALDIEQYCVTHPIIKQDVASDALGVSVAAEPVEDFDFSKLIEDETELREVKYNDLDDEIPF